MKITLRIYSKTKPTFEYTTVEIYKLEDSKPQDTIWYTELPTKDYISTRVQLERLGYLARPASSSEIDTGILTIFNKDIV